MHDINVNRTRAEGCELELRNDGEKQGEKKQLKQGLYKNASMKAMTLYTNFKAEESTKLLKITNSHRPQDQHT